MDLTCDPAAIFPCVAVVRQGSLRVRLADTTAFRILGNWKTRKTPLWLAVSNLNEFEGPEVRIVDVSTELAGVV